MSWIFLVVAAIFEIGWPVGLKLAQINSFKVFWVLFAIAAMALSGIFLYLAQKNIPIGTAYSVWTGIGAIGTFVIGIMFFNDAINLMRFFGIILIVSGVILMKLAH